MSRLRKFVHHKEVKIVGAASMAVLLILSAFLLGRQKSPEPTTTTVLRPTLTPAQVSDSVEGEAILVNRKNLAPGSDSVTESSSPSQTLIKLHFVAGKLQPPTTVQAKVGENLKLEIVCDEMDEEYDLVIIGFAQRATCSQNSSNHMEFTPGVGGTFPLELMPEEGEREKVGELVIL